MSDLIDDMLVGDYDYAVDGEHIYADIDYQRRSDSQSLALGAPVRRAGAVRPAEVVCVPPSRPLLGCGPAATAGARLRGAR